MRNVFFAACRRIAFLPRHNMRLVLSALLTVALLPLLGGRAVRRRLRQIPPFLAVALFAALSLTAVAGLNGCSGAGLFAARKVPYSITVTATEGTVQRTTGVPLGIQ
jgi:hypothetical protein